MITLSQEDGGHQHEWEMLWGVDHGPGAIAGLFRCAVCGKLKMVMG